MPGQAQAIVGVVRKESTLRGRPLVHAKFVTVTLSEAKSRLNPSSADPLSQQL